MQPRLVVADKAPGFLQEVELRNNPDTKPMQFERRRAPRHAFGGVTEMSAGHADSHIIGLIAEISRFGCFVRTHASMPVGTTISLRITHDGSELTAHGEVAYVLFEKGVGIKFAEVAAEDAALLEAWLRQTCV
jgi:hypothetical protein